MSFSKVFDDATATALEDVRRGRFDLQSEKDIQAVVFHYAILLAEKLGLPLKLHAEPTRAEGNYHSAPSSANYFNPSVENLRGGWKQLGESTRFLLAEL